jgi:hypothetical protein
VVRPLSEGVYAYALERRGRPHDGGPGRPRGCDPRTARDFTPTR